MPDINGYLTDVEKSKLRKWLAARANESACASCGKNKWSLAEHMVHMPIWTGRYSPGGESTAYPALLVVCKGCGHMRFYSAVGTGVLSADEVEAAPELQIA